MSGDVSISEGGYTAVSSDSLREAAARALAVASLLRESVTAGTRAGELLDGMSVRIPTADDVAQATGMAATLAQLIEVFAAQLARAADIYEAVELVITANMNGTTPAVEQRLAELEAARPGIGSWALDLAMWSGGLKGYASLQSLPRSGKEVFIVDRKITHTTQVSSVVPKGAADLAKSIPDGHAQIRVDRYNMPDGSQRFVVSVSGTRAIFSGLQPFDMLSNAALYTGHDSTSAEAVRRALEDAGVAPGDWLLMNAHSQAAMIADRLAPDTSVDPDMVVTWGNPGERPMPSDVINIDIKHTDDPVGWLGGDEFPIPTGADESFEVSRDVTGVADVSPLDAFDPHLMDAYVETAMLMDASQDPRMDALRDPLAELAQAESVTTTEYTVWEQPLIDPDSARAVEAAGRAGDGFGSAAREMTGGGGQLGQRDGVQFEFSDPVRPDQMGFAPPPEPGPPHFEFGELPSPDPAEPPPVTAGSIDVPVPENDNHAGPWRL